MKKNYTPGPWERRKYDEVQGADCRPVYFRSVTTLAAGPQDMIDEAEANTQLAIAAPDLVEALEKILTLIDNQPQDRERENHIRSYIEIALKKAGVVE